MHLYFQRLISELPRKRDAEGRVTEYSQYCMMDNGETGIARREYLVVFNIKLDGKSTACGLIDEIHIFMEA